MKRPLIIGAVVLALVLVVGFYLASPLLAVRSLQAAIADRDTTRLERLVDFPTVRDGLKRQVNAQIMTSLQTEPSLQDNPFAGLAALMAPMVVEQAVDAYVTPEGMAALLESDSPSTAPVPAAAQASTPAAAGAIESKGGDKPDLRWGYKGFNTFSVAPADAEGVQFVLTRQGLFGWKLTRIDLPRDLIARSRR